MPRIEIDRSRAVSDQELFNQVATHLFTQGQQAVDARNHCRYRGYEGRSCSIGCRIPDSEYSEELEPQAVWDAALRRAAAIPTAQIKLADALQGVHDRRPNWTTTERMKGHLGRVASTFGLSRRVLNTLAFSDR